MQDLVANFVGCGYNLLIDANPAINLLDHIISGDGRANENVSLTAMHAVWVRNHNHHADQLAELYGDARIDLSQEELFQAAKIVNEAEYQRVIFTEFAEKLLGGQGILGDGNHGFRDYKPDADASISLEFQAIAFRIGHTMIPDDLWILGDDGQITPTPLFDLFLNPTNDPEAFSVDHDRNPATAPLSGDAALAVLARMGYTPTPGFNELGTGAIIGGIVEQPAEAVDGQMVDAVRNDLVRVRADLFSQNVARGWDEGLGTLNQIRHGLLASTSSYVQEAISYLGAANLQPYGDWDDFQTRNGLSDTVIDQFKLAYPDLVLSAADWQAFQVLNPEIEATPSGDTFVVKGIDRVDAWVGGLCEAKVDIDAQGKPAVVGSTFWVILHEQLDRLQEADRHYYIPRLENLDLYPNFVEGITFSEIVTRNTGLANLPESIFDVFNPNAQGPTFGTLPATEPVAPPAEPVVVTPDPVVTAPDPVAPVVVVPPVGPDPAVDPEADADAESEDLALKLGMQIVKDPSFPGDEANQLNLRRFGTDQEQDSSFYLALTAENLRAASLNTVDFTVALGENFNEVFEISEDNVFFTEDMDVQRRVQLIKEEGSTSIRFVGAGLDNLDDSGKGIGAGESTVLAYIKLNLVGKIDDLIKGERVLDQYGFKNEEGFEREYTFDSSINVDEVLWSDLFSLRDLMEEADGPVVTSASLDVTVKAAAAVLTTESSFDLGTYRQVLKEGEDGFTNLIRSGDTIMQTSTWTNGGEFTFTNLHLSNIEDEVAEVVSKFEGGSNKLAELGWSDLPGEGEVATINTTFHITGKAGSVLDTTKVGYKLEAYGDYAWDTTEMEQFAVKNLITFQGDLNYDGAVSMADLAYLNKGAKDRGYARDVDANFDDKIDMEDLDVIDREWGETLHHKVDGAFMGSDKISMAELFKQDGHEWDSSAFAKRNALERGLLEEPVYLPVLSNDSPGLISGPIGGVDELERLLTEQVATPV